jgi:hypothetical protein
MVSFAFLASAPRYNQAMRWLLKRWWAWTAFAAAVTILLAAGLLTFGSSRITPKSLDRIVEGMTLQEVEAILGGPPCRIIDPPDLMRRSPWPPHWCCWMDDSDNRIEVAFDTQMRLATRRGSSRDRRPCKTD